MRKVKLSMQMTINGYVAGPNGENDWMTWNPDDEFLQFLNAEYDSSDTMLLGRKLAKGNLAEEIASLKQQNGKDIIVIGGAGFVSSLINEGLIDEYHLIVNPTA